MKTIYLLIPGLLLFILCSCNYFKSTHPQAELANEDGATSMNDKSILQFSATMDKNLQKFKKEYSLIYNTGDLSVYAEKYSGYDNGILYQTYTNNGNISSTVKSYYFKNDSLILVNERDKLRNDEGEVFKDQRTYLRNDVIFKIDSRTASSNEALIKLPYLPVQPAESKFPQQTFTDDIKSINDAIYGRDRFEMLFDNITTYPDAHYIMLKAKNHSSYKASLRVNQRDPFIDSLLNSPAIFKDERLKLKWKIADNEAIYVPVADTSTSARGLNK